MKDPKKVEVLHMGSSKNTDLCLGNISCVFSVVKINDRGNCRVFGNLSAIFTQNISVSSMHLDIVFIKQT